MQGANTLERRVDILVAINRKSRDGEIIWQPEPTLRPAMTSGLLGGSQQIREVWQSKYNGMRLRLTAFSKIISFNLANFVETQQDSLEVLNDDGQTLDLIANTVGLDALIATVRRGPDSLNEFYDKLLG